MGSGIALSGRSGAVSIQEAGHTIGLCRIDTVNKALALFWILAVHINFARDASRGNWIRGYNLTDP